MPDIREGAHRAAIEPLDEAEQLGRDRGGPTDKSPEAEEVGVVETVAAETIMLAVIAASDFSEHYGPVREMIEVRLDLRISRCHDGIDPTRVARVSNYSCRFPKFYPDVGQRGV
jgi:hypothetical protein